jgi:phage tail protein X
MPETIHTTQDGDMLDEICWRHYGRQSGAVEAVLEYNRGLGDLGPVYGSGLQIRLPVLTVGTDAVRRPVRLWD